MLYGGPRYHLRWNGRRTHAAAERWSQALELIDGFNDVEGRDAWFAGSAIVNGQRVGPPLGIRSVAANSNGSVLFANVHVGGIPRSLDDGKSWQPTIDINCDVHEVRAHHADPEIVVAAAAVGLCISRDSGTTWTIEREGLHAPHCYAIAISGDDILFSAAQDPFAAEGRIYRRPLRPDGIPAAVEGGMPTWTEGRLTPAASLQTARPLRLLTEPATCTTRTISE